MRSSVDEARIQLILTIREMRGEPKEHRSAPVSVNLLREVAKAASGRPLDGTLGMVTL